ncbi:hypothetical protein SAMD00019534_090150 [Acytostelium subglobosum LB1]|uniref:hypothetical protein n=1 Tax=Acytostelium subglobosum LB1 TaxID=1410327 RepID=UPI00064498C9|nr:hypothetical protein SAMD00019534_090150 [Acytostelium subglobosum LB1]GAM25840.1 hypothetical protein SAMD00019534_090150 [Acytostelium subglobosum LB1]|eukprot:XP_012751358.1 hypothetical protein SAMD00019534_090150 [Acytostelium subglobosum LB1]
MGQTESKPNNATTTTNNSNNNNNNGNGNGNGNVRNDMMTMNMASGDTGNASTVNGYFNQHQYQYQAQGQSQQSQLQQLQMLDPANISALISNPAVASALLYDSNPYTSYSYEKKPTKEELDVMLKYSRPGGGPSPSGDTDATRSDSASAADDQTKDEEQDEEDIEPKEPEIERLELTPQFYPLYKRYNNPLFVPDMDEVGVASIGINLQHYLKNSTGYINDKQHQLLERVRDVDFNKSSKFTRSFIATVNDVKQSNVNIKDVMDKVNDNILNITETIKKVGDMIEMLELVLPPEERENFKNELMAVTTTTTTTTTM